MQKIGGPEVLELNQIPVPTAGENEVVIKNEYAGVNYIDKYFRTGLYPVKFPFTFGSEGAGTVDSVGSGVTKFKPGDKVAYHGSGAYADYVAVGSENVGHLPEGFSSEEAAALIIQGLTSLTMLRESYTVQKGDTILVHAAAGGCGLLLVQLAKAIGATVIATASSQEKLDIAKNAGADYLVNYSHGEDQWVKEVLEHTKDGLGVEAVFDGVGAATFDGDLKVTKRKGTVVSYGNASGAVPPFSILRLGEKNLKILRPRLYGYIATTEEYEQYVNELFTFVKSGQVKINIYKTYSLENYPDAAKDIEGRHSTGKLLIKL